MTSSTHGKAVLNLVLEILQAAPKLQLKGDKFTQDIGLTSSRWWCLVHVSDNDGRLTVADIARRMNLQRQTVQRFAEALVENDMVFYGENPDHKRARLLSITEKGKRALATVEQRELAWAENTINDLGAEDIQATINTLSRLRDEITEQFGGR